ncbi:ABC transporter permease [Trujillonella endophytica]|uniref:Peptide/nickel transport system permease protein n=1 Tax=Trujillonella endophytica TaxID=673521 RepID=A0A1H8UWD0_9ACTN|nr:ABC transporter permease [Trujillella endophytica]SEP07461.1 peptide/nickel transport system permease protein [Trujillella endophytica]
MLVFTAKRVVRALLVILFATFLVVALLSIAPGSLAVTLLGDAATPDAVAELEARLGLDEPLWEQYFGWLGDAVTGDFGTSLRTRQDVLDSVLERLPVTLELALLALVIALAVSVPMALAAANRPGSPIDRVSTFLASVGLALPAFVVAPVLVYFLSVQAGLFPVAGWERVGEGVGANLHHALLPAIAVAIPEIAAFQRLLRTDLDSTLHEDFISAARARGLSRSYILWRHALRPSSFSLVTLAGISFGRLIGGTVIVEAVFTLPGLGSLIAGSIASRDVIAVQGAVAFIVIAYVVINTLVDIGYGFLDPRVRREAV